jgi:GMP synthase (glutamine-hydrolysing)
MRPVLFLQNGEEDGPGLFARVLSGMGISLEVIHAWRGDRLPETLAAYRGLAVGGGGMSAYQSDRFLAEEVRLLRCARDTGTPVLGFCLGAQLLSLALGGRVFPNYTREIGLFEVRFTPEAGSDPLWQGHTAPFFPIHWHGDTFSLPPGAVWLASSRITPHQLFRWGPRMYGFQFHLEFDLPVVREMIRSDAPLLEANGVDPHRLLADAERHLPGVEPVGRAVFSRWAGLLDSQ